MNSEILAEMRKIAKKNGGILSPIDVVEEARQPKSPLHDKFEWDTTKAAYAWNLQQARQLISVSVAYYEGRDDKKISTRVFVSLSKDRQADGGYRLLDTVLSTEVLRKQLLQDALKELRHFQEKYSTLTELADVFAAIRLELESSEDYEEESEARV